MRQIIISKPKGRNGSEETSINNLYIIIPGTKPKEIRSANESNWPPNLLSKLNFLAINPSIKSKNKVIKIRNDMDSIERLSSTNSNVIIHPKKRLKSVKMLGIILINKIESSLLI